MRYPYLITSDQHCHSWDQFKKVNPDGVNSRLRIILGELERAYDTLVEKGGCEAFMAGDLFHIRGKIEPSVFNPTFRVMADIHDRHDDLGTYAIPGNHDLEGREAEAIGNAMQSLSSIEGFIVDTDVRRHGDVIVIPWQHDLDHLRSLLAGHAAKAASDGMLGKTDVIIHAPVNGVIKGIPDHGLEAGELAAYGFRRVFAGHYHDHKTFCDGNVISVGATTHQTWSDVGTAAGFLLVYEDRIEHYPSQAPQFRDMLGWDGEDLGSFVKGHYIRARLDDVTEKEIAAYRADILKAGALGVNLSATKKVTTGRSGAAAKSAVSLDASVAHYIEHDLKPVLPEEVTKLALEVLNEARS